MANEEHLAILLRGTEAWNAWRRDHPDVRPDLSGADLTGMQLAGVDLRRAILTWANLSEAFLGGANLSEADLDRARLIGTIFGGANLSKASLAMTDLARANFVAANLSDADLRWASCLWGNFNNANLTRALLLWANLTGTNFWRAILTGAHLNCAILVHANMMGADLTDCSVFGVAAWDLELNEETKQKNLIVTPSDQPKITVDNLEMAQFIYLLLHNKKIRRVIETITSKVVLILGRFTPERKAVLDALRDELRKRDLLPVVFDFSIPSSLDVTETVKVLAGLARFVIADITDATEVRVELHNIVREFTSLAVRPILLRGQPEFISLQHLKKFPWVLPSFEYDSQEHLLANLDKSVIGCAEAKVLELRGVKRPG